MELEYLSSEDWSDDVETFHLTPAVQAGGVIHISGTSGGSESDDPETQLVAAFEDVAGMLAMAGASWDDVFKMTTYHLGGIHEHFELLLEVKDRYVKPPYPAWTGVGVTDLANRSAVVEIDVMAVAPA